MILLQLPRKRLMQQRLKQVFGLAQGFPLLGAQPFILADDLGELLL